MPVTVRLLIVAFATAAITLAFVKYKLPEVSITFAVYKLVHTFDEILLTVILPVPVTSSTPLTIKLLVLTLDATKLPVTIALPFTVANVAVTLFKFKLAFATAAITLAFVKYKLPAVSITFAV